MVFLDNGYEELEFWYPRIRLQEAGAIVDAAARAAGEYTGKHGYPARAALSFGDVDAAAYDALVIPGGYAPDRIRRDVRALTIAKEIYRAGKPVAAICHGPQVLISAGLLAGKKATAFESIRDDVVNAGAVFVDEEVVVDGHLITSRTPDDLPAFCRAILKKMRG